MRRALEAIFGKGGFSIVEGANAGTYNGSKLHDGSSYYGQPENWAVYSVFVNRTLSIAQANDVRRVLESVAPARCELLALNYQQALNAYDNTIRYDNTYTHGVA
ncbi:hypothetical protein D9M68_792550 [compost metagenome]